MTDTPDALTRALQQWTQRNGAPPAAATRLVAQHDAATLRQTAAAFEQDAKGVRPVLQACCGTNGAALLRELADLREGEPPAAPVPSAEARLELPLTARQKEVLVEVARGGSRDEVAERLGMSTHTLKVHLRRASFRMGATSTTHLVALAIAMNLIPADSALTADLTASDGGEPR